VHLAFLGSSTAFEELADYEPPVELSAPTA
jgi:hypothetical protein